MMQWFGFVVKTEDVINVNEFDSWIGKYASICIPVFIVHVFLLLLSSPHNTFFNLTICLEFMENFALMIN